MRKAMILTLTLALLLGGCAQEPPAVDTEPTAQVAETPRTWDYDLVTETETDEYYADDGTLLAAWSDEKPVLRMKSSAGETYQTGTDGVTEAQLAVCRAFNDGAAARAEDARASWERLKADALEQYTEMGEEHRDLFETHTEETTVSVTRRGELLEITEQMYGYWGGVHGGSTFATLHFDLGAGEFLTLDDLSGDGAALRAAIVEDVTEQIYAQGLEEMCFDDFETLLGEMQDFTGTFGDEGLNLIFEQYAIAPYAAGVLEFTVPYARLSPLLNERALTLLAVPNEEKVLGDFDEAKGD